MSKNVHNFPSPFSFSFDTTDKLIIFPAIDIGSSFKFTI